MRCGLHKEKAASTPCICVCICICVSTVLYWTRGVVCIKRRRQALREVTSNQLCHCADNSLPKTSHLKASLVLNHTAVKTCNPYPMRCLDFQGQPNLSLRWQLFLNIRFEGISSSQPHWLIFEHNRKLTLTRLLLCSSKYILESLKYLSWWKYCTCTSSKETHSSQTLIEFQSFQGPPNVSKALSMICHSHRRRLLMNCRCTYGVL